MWHTLNEINRQFGKKEFFSGRYYVYQRVKRKRTSYSTVTISRLFLCCIHFIIISVSAYSYYDQCVYRTSVCIDYREHQYCFMSNDTNRKATTIWQVNNTLIVYMKPLCLNNTKCLRLFTAIYFVSLFRLKMYSNAF